MTDEEKAYFKALKDSYPPSSSTAFPRHVLWLLTQMDRLLLENESLTFQLQDRIKIEHDHNAYIEIAKEKCQWVIKCANLSRKVAELEDKLKGK